MTENCGVFVVTVKVVEPEMLPKVDVITGAPIESAEASPVELMLASMLCEELQVTPVSFCVRPLLYVPIAVNC